MAEPDQSREMWLVAAWPGLGNVGVGAVAYLINALDAKLTHELPARDVFDLTHVDVSEGLARAGRLPRSMFFEWHDPNAPRDLLIFIGESQPPTNGYQFCHRVMEYAASRHVSRVITFAAMATQLHPSDTPRSVGIATTGEGIRDLQALEVKLLKEGQISGLNGVLLAAAAERTIPGVCLLGELPFFAGAVPNPKASMAVLEVFTSLAGIEIDMTELKEQAKAVEKALLQMLEKLQETAQQQASEEGFTVESEEEAENGAVVDEHEEESAEETKQSPAAPKLDLAARQRIESLFTAAAEDQAKAFALKQELDRLGVFKQYEDRFLDLFRKGQ